jgi:recombination protein RecA
MGIDLAALTKGIADKFKKTNKEIVYDPKRAISFISTGVPVADLVMGGGFPRGRITEVFGLEHSCKTALCLNATAGVVNTGGIGVLLDHETAHTESYTSSVYSLSSENPNFQVFQPDNLEEGSQIIDMLEQLDKLDILVIDSIDAMRPKAWINHEMKDGDPRVGQHAKSMGMVIAKLRILAKHKNCAVVLINQMRSSINTGYEQNPGTGAGFNVKETYVTTGGHAARFYASLRIKMEYAAKIEDETGSNVVMGSEGDKTRIGNKVKVINVKNKVATPFLKGVTNFYFPMPTRGQRGGFSPGRDYIDLLRGRGRVDQRGAKMTILGHEDKAWVQMGSKAASETKFSEDPAFVEDARKYIEAQSRRGAVLEMALQGEDYAADDMDESKAAETLKSIGMEIDPDDAVVIDQPQTVSEITL